MKKLKFTNNKIFASLFFCLLCFSFDVFAQNGGLRGTITDESGEPLMDVNVVIPKLNKGAVTEWDGTFQINNIPAGRYDIFINLIGYKGDTLRAFNISPGEPVTLDHALKNDGNEDIIDLDFEIVGTKVTGTDKAVIEEVKESKEIVTAMGEEQISRSQDRTAADVMSRIPGVTVQDGRFIIVRGLTQRYNTVMLNGILAPSTEPDARAFSFDVVPSRMIDRMLVYKSGSADLPGEFGGALIHVHTKSVLDDNFIKVNLTGGHRQGTTFNNFQAAPASGTDFLGFDGGRRALPQNFPTRNLREVQSLDVLNNATKGMENTWGARNTIAAPDLRASVDIARSWKLGYKKISTFTSLGYTNTNQYNQIEQHRYDQFIPEENRVVRNAHFRDEYFANTVRLSAMSNWRLQLSDKTIIQFKNLFNQMGTSEVVNRTGERGPVEDPLFETRAYALRYFSRRYYSSQLNLSQDLARKRGNFTLVAGYSNVNRLEPDYRRAREQKRYGTDEPFQFTIPRSATTFDAARFWSEMTENTYSFNANLNYNLTKRDSANVVVNTGFYGEQKNRDFAARWFSYIRGREFNEDITYLPIDQIFAPEHMGTADGFVLSEGTNFTDSYTAFNRLFAGYVGTVIPINKLKISGGIRGELFRQNLESAITPTTPLVIDTTVFSPLPFANISYDLSKKTITRLAYSRSVNRPYFRELAPFLYYDFLLNIDVGGNPDLQTAHIHNLDARWEFYPSESEFIALGAFYKYFNDPIETAIDGSENLIYTYRNADNAVNYGLELEIRKSMLNLTQNRFLQNFSLVLNAAYIYSRLTMESVQNQIANRPLQGQSPYVFNSGLYYIDKDKGLMVNLMYNVYGRRIFAVGNEFIGNIYELPRNVIDVTIGKQLRDNLDLKVGVADLFNAPFRFYEDVNNDTQITDIDAPWLTYRRGQYFTASLTYKF